MKKKGEKKRNELNVIVQTKLHEGWNNQPEKRSEANGEKKEEKEQTMRKEIEWMCV